MNEWTKKELSTIAERFNDELIKARAEYKPPEKTRHEKRVEQVAEILNIKRSAHYE